jgi:hypothetical protein
MSDSEQENCVSCANHLCGKEIDTQSDKHVVCSLCRGPIYCGNACLAMDWASHACTNAYASSGSRVMKQIAAPYFYEDLLPREITSEFDARNPVFQSFAMVHYGADMQVSTRIQPALIGLDAVGFAASGDTLGRGSAPGSLLLGRSKSFFVSVNLLNEDNDNVTQSVAVKGTLPYNMIFKENNQNPTARRLAGFAVGTDSTSQKLKTIFQGARSRFSKSTTSLLFWPDPVELARVSQRTFFPLTGTLNVVLQVENQRPLNIRSAYDLTSTIDDSRLGKSLKKHFEARLQAKFPGKDAGIKNMHVRHAYANDGTRVVLVFAIPQGVRDRARLVDIEYMAPDQLFDSSASLSSSGDGQEDMESKIGFKCDPRDVDHMTGLTMAIGLALQPEHLKTTDETTLKNLQNQAGVIRNYTRGLLELKTKGEGPPERVPIEVNTAIYTIVNALYDNDSLAHIAGQMQQKKYLDKITRGGPAAARVLANTLRKRMESARSATGGIKKAVSQLTKMRTRRDLNDLDAAITQASRQAGLTQETRDAYAAVQRDVIVPALTPTTTEED